MVCLFYFLQKKNIFLTFFVHIYHFLHFNERDIKKYKKQDLVNFYITSIYMRLFLAKKLNQIHFIKCQHIEKLNFILFFY